MGASKGVSDWALSSGGVLVCTAWSGTARYGMARYGAVRPYIRWVFLRPRFVSLKLTSLKVAHKAPGGGGAEGREEECKTFLCGLVDGTKNRTSNRSRLEFGRNK